MTHEGMESFFRKRPFCNTVKALEDRGLISSSKGRVRLPSCGDCAENQRIRFLTIGVGPKTEKAARTTAFRSLVLEHMGDYWPTVSLAPEMVYDYLKQTTSDPETKGFFMKLRFFGSILHF
jgi:hypothetical protein